MQELPEVVPDKAIPGASPEDDECGVSTDIASQKGCSGYSFSQALSEKW